MVDTTQLTEGTTVEWTEETTTGTRRLKGTITNVETNIAGSSLAGNRREVKAFHFDMTNGEIFPHTPEADVIDEETLQSDTITIIDITEA